MTPKRVRSPEYLKWQREYQSKKRIDRRNKAIELLGGQCVQCRVEKDLHFDHIDPSTKKFPISRSSSDKVFWETIPLCQLLCKNCHREKSNKEISGESCHASKLSHEDVKKILVRIKKGIPQVEIAKEFGVGAMQISRIKNGTRWRYMTDDS